MNATLPESPAYSDAAAAPFNTLLEAMRAELAALDTGDAEAIELATRAKLSALVAARDAGPAPRARLAEARDLNALASARVNMLMASVGRRLETLAAASGRAPTLVYGRGGQGLQHG